MATKVGHRPVICVSKCLGFASCRYDGTAAPSGFVRKLSKKVKFVAYCPEVAIGLGVPRDPVRIVAGRGGRRLIQPATGLDLTRKMDKKCREILGALPAVDGFILKSRSPSCGLRDAKIYSAPGSAVPAGKGAGFFGRAVLKKFPRLPVEDESRLKDPGRRERFLRKIFGAGKKEI